MPLPSSIPFVSIMLLRWIFYLLLQRVMMVVVVVVLVLVLVLLYLGIPAAVYSSTSSSTSWFFSLPNVMCLNVYGVADRAGIKLMEATLYLVASCQFETLFNLTPPPPPSSVCRLWTRNNAIRHELGTPIWESKHKSAGDGDRDRRPRSLSCLFFKLPSDWWADTSATTSETRASSWELRWSRCSRGTLASVSCMGKQLPSLWCPSGV